MTEKAKWTDCPFCGMDEPDHCDEEVRGQTWNYIQCRDTSCQAEGPRELTKEEAIEKWNRRHGLAGIPDPAKFVRAANGMALELERTHAIEDCHGPGCPVHEVLAAFRAASGGIDALS